MELMNLNDSLNVEVDKDPVVGGLVDTTGNYEQVRIFSFFATCSHELTQRLSTSYRNKTICQRSASI